MQKILRGRGYNDGMMSMARCKCYSRKQAILARNQLRIQQANLPHALHPRTFENFQARAGSEDMLAACRRFTQNEGAWSIALVGLNGTGKSHMLEAIGREMLKQGLNVRYEFVSALIDRLRHTHEEDSKEDIADLMDWYKRMYLLLLDDVGAERLTPFGAEKVVELIEDRLQHESRLALATNLTYEEMIERCGPRMASRIYQGNPALGDMLVVPIGASDYRR